MPTQLAAYRSRKIIKAAIPNQKMPQELVNSITFCAEYITRFLMLEAQKVAKAAGKSVITYDDVRKVVEEQPGFAFLDDTVPQKWVDE